MYYNRTMQKLHLLFAPDGALRWLVGYVKRCDDLDFQTGRNANDEWVSVYRGLTRLVRIGTDKAGMLKLSADKKYMALQPSLYGKFGKDHVFEAELEGLRQIIANATEFESSYDNKKEGFYQNIFSRRYGLLGMADDPFIIVDKESVIGFGDKSEEEKICSLHRAPLEETMSFLAQTFPKDFGSKLGDKKLGKELDFIAIGFNGDVLLIEYKDGHNTNGIYGSPFQMGMYQALFSALDRGAFQDAVLDCARQKQQMGMLHPSWPIPAQIRSIRSVLVVSDYPGKSTAKAKFSQVLGLCRERMGASFLEGLTAFHFTTERKLEAWHSGSGTH